MDKLEFDKRMKEIRARIDGVDSELLPLLIERMKCSEEVARLKGAADMPVFDASREKVIIEQVREKSGDYGDSTAEIYEHIMDVSKKRQRELIDKEK